MVLRYYTAWNFTWWALAEGGLVQVSYPLGMSIMFTSAVGGFVTYIYPRRFVIKLRNYRIKVNRKLSILFDLITHQLPLYRYMYCLKYTQGICGANTLIPLALYAGCNTYRNIKLQSVYGIKGRYIYGASVCAITGGGIYHHLIKNKK
jgi:hypothetical protein